MSPFSLREIRIGENGYRLPISERDRNPLHRISQLGRTLLSFGGRCLWSLADVPMHVHEGGGGGLIIERIKCLETCVNGFGIRDISTR